VGSAAAHCWRCAPSVRPRAAVRGRAVDVVDEDPASSVGPCLRATRREGLSVGSRNRSARRPPPGRVRPSNVAQDARHLRPGSRWPCRRMMMTRMRIRSRKVSSASETILGQQRPERVSGPHRVEHRADLALPGPIARTSSRGCRRRRVDRTSRSADDHRLATPSSPRGSRMQISSKTIGGRCRIVQLRAVPATAAVPPPRTPRCGSGWWWAPAGTDVNNRVRADGLDVRITQPGNRFLRRNLIAPPSVSRQDVLVTPSRQARGELLVGRRAAADRPASDRGGGASFAPGPATHRPAHGPHGRAMSRRSSSRSCGVAKIARIAARSVVVTAAVCLK